MKRTAKLASMLALVLAIVLPPGSPAVALSVEPVTTPRGLTAWLAEDHQSSIVAVRFAFIGGTAAEPKQQAGLTRLLARLLVQGGGHGDPQSFQKQAQRIGLRLNFQAGRDALYGSIDVPAQQLGAARQLLLEVFNTAHQLDSATVEEARASVVAAIAEEAADPRAAASNAWYAQAFAGHGYANPSQGDAQVVAAAEPGAIASLRMRMFARSNLVVSAAGALSPGDLATLLDAMFGDLPVRTVESQAKPRFAPGIGVRIHADTDAASIAFGLPSVPPGHPDFGPVRVLAHVIGSGDLDSRLIEELRLRRGLAYSAQLSPVHDRLVSVIFGEVVTSPEHVVAALAALRAVLDDVRSGHVSDGEIANAKLALTGGDLVSLDSNGRIADAMLGARLDGEEPGFLEQRVTSLRAVTPEQVRRIGKELLAPENLLTTVVTRPSPAK